MELLQALFGTVLRGEASDKNRKLEIDGTILTLKIYRIINWWKMRNLMDSATIIPCHQHIIEVSMSVSFNVWSWRVDQIPFTQSTAVLIKKILWFTMKKTRRYWVEVGTQKSSIKKERIWEGSLSLYKERHWPGWQLQLRARSGLVMPVWVSAGAHYTYKWAAATKMVSAIVFLLCIRVSCVRFRGVVCCRQH